MNIQNYINNIVMVIDASSSMQHLQNDVVKVVDGLVEHLAARSKELEQDTRISVYFFGSDVKCAVWDRDSLRLPSIKGLYSPYGMTALIDGTLKAVDDLEKIPELYGDHSRLVYVISDGAENYSKKTFHDLSNKLKNLPENYTVAFLAPDQTSVHEAKKAGFPAENISIWDFSSKKGLEEAGKKIKDSADNFMRARATGVRGTRNLFTVDVKFTKRDVERKLDELGPNEYELLSVNKESPIKDYVESWKLPFVKGANYYQLTKPEKIQGYKQICVQDKIKGKVYTGINARKLLNLPDFEVKVSPGNFKNYDIFIQSTSVNRRLVPGTKLIVLK